jgi:hypothetical protein
VSTTRRPRHPPKLQHVLKNEIKHGERQHDLVKKLPRDDGTMEAPDFDQSDYGETKVEEYTILIRHIIIIYNDYPQYYYTEIIIFNLKGCR